MKYLIIICGLIASQASVAQNQDDVLRYSLHNSFSTARTAGMGGAFGALGADISSLSSNPAGLGLYRRGEFSITPNIGGSGTTSSFKGTDTDNSDFHLKLNSIGYITSQEPRKKNVNMFSYGIGYNRLANFSSNFSIKGTNENSLLDVLVERTNGINAENIYDAADFSSIVAWDAFLIDTIPGTIDQYQSAIPSGSSDHEITVERNGGMGEMLFGGGANINNRFYWGVTIGIPIVNYTQELTHKETPNNPSVSLTEFTYTESLEVSGGGLNAKLGIILKASDKLRVGAAYHTRTTLGLTDTYSYGVIANYQGDILEPEDVVGTYDYRIVIPSRLMANASFIAGKSALVSADYEFVNYASGKLKRSTLSNDTYTFEQENNLVRQGYRETHNVRVGAEFRIANSYRVRFGTRFMQNPFAENVVGDEAAGSTFIYTVGGGYRKGSFYADVAAAYSQVNTEHFMYDSNFIDVTQVQTNRTNLIFTVGFRL